MSQEWTAEEISHNLHAPSMRFAAESRSMRTRSRRTPVIGDSSNSPVATVMGSRNNSRGNVLFNSARSLRSLLANSLGKVNIPSDKAVEISSPKVAGGGDGYVVMTDAKDPNVKVEVV